MIAASDDLDGQVGNYVRASHGSYLNCGKCVGNIDSVKYQAGNYSVEPYLLGAIGGRGCNARGRGRLDPGNVGNAALFHGRLQPGELRVDFVDVTNPCINVEPLRLVYLCRVLVLGAQPVEIGTPAGYRFRAPSVSGAAVSCRYR